MAGSKQLLRTTPALTANFKLVVTSDYKLYMESFDSNAELADEKYKHFSVGENALMTERVPSFFRGMPAELAFQTRKHAPSDTVQTDYTMQLDDAYWAGAAAVEDRWYQEEYEYHAPLWVDPKRLPKHFVVLRVDGPGAYNMQPEESFEPGREAAGMREEVLERWQCVKLFDLRPSSPLGMFLDLNYTSNAYFPPQPFELNLRKQQFSTWHGYDIRSGGFGTRPVLFHDTMSAETTHFALEETVVEGFKQGGLAVPHILNAKFLFDDTPGRVSGTNTTKRKWPINRYYGFYLDELELVRQVSPYVTVTLNQAAALTDNVFAGDPTADGWPTGAPALHAKRGDRFVTIQKRGATITGTGLVARDSEADAGPSVYVLIDSSLHTGVAGDFSPSPAVVIQHDPAATARHPNGRCFIKNADGSPLAVPGFDEHDLHLIEVAGQMYALLRDGSTAGAHFYINTDARLETTTRVFRRAKAGVVDDDIRFDDVTANEQPLQFSIYRAKFTDVADLDFERLDTGYAGYEYERPNALEQTDEPKLWALDRRVAGVMDDAYPETGYIVTNDDDTQRVGAQGAFHVPASSEYAAGDDLWMLDQGDNLTAIWDKNPHVPKWGMQGSISHNDYPYKLNNSSRVGGAYNRAPSHHATRPHRRTCNLDWFYTVGTPRVENPNGMLTPDMPDYWSLTTEYTSNRTLEVDARPIATVPMDQDVVDEGIYGEPGAQPFWNYQHFDLDAYEDPLLPFDYFEWFFRQEQVLQLDADTQARRAARKYATFGPSDSVNGPTALFRGLRVTMQWTSPASPQELSKMRVVPADDLAGYKFAALLTKRPTDDTTAHGDAGVTVYVNRARGNVLVAVWVAVPRSSLTNFESTYRDALYDQTELLYDLDKSAPVPAAIGPQHLTLLNVMNAINDPTQDWGFTASTRFVVVEDTPSYRITDADAVALDPTKLQLQLHGTAAYREGDWLAVPGFPAGDTNGGNYRVSKVTHTDATTTVVLDTRTNQFGTEVGEANLYVQATRDARPFLARVTAPDLLPLYDGAYEAEATSIELKAYNDVRTLGTRAVARGTLGGVIYQTLRISAAVVKRAAERLLASVYNGQPVVRRLVRKLSSQPGTPTLNIFRHSGAYEPIMRELPLFSPPKLSQAGRVLLEDAAGADATEQPALGCSVDELGYLTVPVPVSGAVAGQLVCIASTQAVHTDLDGYRLSRVRAVQQIDGQLRAVLDMQVDPADVPVGAYVVFMTYAPGNAKFDTGLQDFGTIRELLVSKTNPTGSPLQTSRPTSKYRSVYPMLDEHGMSVVPRFVFKSSWDDEFYLEAKRNTVRLLIQTSSAYNNQQYSV